MVRRKLREKSDKKKAPTKATKATSLNPESLTRGQRKRLVNKTHVMAKKSLELMNFLKDEKLRKRIESAVEEFSTDVPEKQVKKPQNTNRRSAPKSQKSQNEMLFVEMQRFQNVMTNDHIKEDPYEAVRQYLEAKAERKE